VADPWPNRRGPERNQDLVSYTHPHDILVNITI
jgi:hypothetical protein